MPLETPSRIVRELASRGYNAEREAVTLLASAANPALALEAAVAEAPDDALRLTVDHVRAVLDTDASAADAPTVVPSIRDDIDDAGSVSDAEPVPDAESVSEAGSASPEPTSAESETAEPIAADTSSSASDSSPPSADLSSASPDASPSSTDVSSSSSDASPSSSDASPSSSDASSSSTDASPAEPTPPPESPPQTTSDPAAESPSTSTGTEQPQSPGSTQSSPVETEGSSDDWGGRDPDPANRSLEIAGDITGRSTGTGEYEDFVTVFRDRYERLSGQLRGRVNYRPANALQDMPGGDDAEMIGLVNDIRSTASGHWLIELEDTTGVFPCLVMKDKDIASQVDELLLDECLAVQGTLSDDGGILFVDSIHFPDVPRTYRPSTADRHVQAALISDVHVGSQEFHADAWHRFADWLHTEEAKHVEYLLIAGDMVEGVGVYPDQDEELDIIDIYDQYEQFSEYLKEVPGDLEIVMIPGNHDAVRLAEPQPGFDEELREIMSAHDARISGNPSTVTIEGVSVLMYHGVSLDEVIAELPEEKASYDDPHKAMYQLLKKRHVAPQYGGHMRLAPEEKDYLVIDDVPDVFHTGHVHKLGWGKYHNVMAVNSGCWQEQTAFQKSVNIDPDVGYAPILDLDTLDMTVRKFT